MQADRVAIVFGIVLLRVTTGYLICGLPPKCGIALIICEYEPVIDYLSTDKSTELRINGL